MFLSKKNNRINSVRHRRELRWDVFLINTIHGKFSKNNFKNFYESKLSAYYIRGFFFNKHNRRLYNILSGLNGSILTPNKYGVELGHSAINTFFNFMQLKKLEYTDINKFFLMFCTSGTIVYNITNPVTNNKLAVASGTFATVYKHLTELNLTKVKLPSGCLKLIPSDSEAYIGRSGNLYYKYVIWGSWGFKYKNLQHRPVVRGVAMNPVDHPNGGRTKVKKPFRNKYNKIAKNGK